MTHSRVLYLGVVLAAALGVGVFWFFSAGRSAAAELEGFHLVCTAPQCNHHFVLTEQEAPAHPRDESGELLRCPKCSGFTARIGEQCPKCGSWFVRDSTRGRMGSSCPQCNPTPGQAAPGLAR